MDLTFPKTTEFKLKGVPVELEFLVAKSTTTVFKNLDSLCQCVKKLMNFNSEVVPGELDFLVAKARTIMSMQVLKIYKIAYIKNYATTIVVDLIPSCQT